MRIVVLFISLLSCWACSSAVSDPSPSQTPGSTPALPAAGGAFLALGDSYTIGQGVAADDRWCVQLADMLRENGQAVTNPDVIARTGWTTTDLQRAVATANPPKTYALVSLLIGVNDQYQGGSPAAYSAQFRALLQTAIRCANNRPERVFVLSIPDWGQSPYAQGRDQLRIGTEIDQFNRAAQQECRARGVAFINITPLTREAAGSNAQFTADGLHYSSAQMRQWAALALPTAQLLLSQ